MKSKRVIAVVLSVAMLVLSLSALLVHAAGSVALSFSSNVPEGGEVAIGETVTYTVSIDSNSGFSFGTLFFDPSDNLEYVGATYRGKTATAEKALSGENAGAYGIIIAGEPITGTDPRFCTVKFKVTGKGSTSVRFSVYQLNNGSAFITPTVNNATITHTVNEFADPNAAKELEPYSYSGYSIEGDFLRGVVEKTTLDAILANFENSERIKVYDGSGREVTSSSALIGTGYTVSLMNGYDKVHTVTVIVLGDVSGNGRIDAADYQRVIMCLFGTFKLEGAYFQAALVAKKANITAMDYQRIKMHIFGTFNVYN